MQSVLAFLTLTDFFQFFRGQLHFHEMGWYKLANEVEINLDFLCSLSAALAVTLMDEDFINKLVQHGNGQIVEVLIFLNQRNNAFCGLLVFLVGFQKFFQSFDLGFQFSLFLAVLCIQSGISGIRQLAQDVVLIDFAEQDFQFIQSVLCCDQPVSLLFYIGSKMTVLCFLHHTDKFGSVMLCILGNGFQQI